MGARTFAWPIASALLGVAAFAPIRFSWLAGLVSLVPLFLFFRNEERLWRLLAGTTLFRLIFLAGVAYSGFEPLGLLASLLMFLGLPLSYALVRRFAGAPAAFWSLPFSWTLWDLLHARYTFLPTYDLMMGSAFGSSPLLGLAGWGGVAGLTLYVAVVNALVAAVIAAGSRTYRLLAAGGAMLLAVAGWIASEELLAGRATAYAARPRELGIAVISSREDFDHPFRAFGSDTLSPAELERAAEFTAQTLRPIRDEVRGHGVDLVAFPEDLIDIESWGDADPEAYEKFGIESGGMLIRAYRALARELDTNVAATFTTIQAGRRYNTTLLFSRTGAIIGRYNKVHLAIGGEYWPFGDWRPFYWNIEWIRRGQADISEESAIFDPHNQYAAGEPTTLRADAFAFASPICIEAQDPGLLRTFRQQGAEFLLHTSNNRWVPFGLNRYLRLLDNFRRIEAVRLDRPIVFNGKAERAGVITPDGRLKAVPFERGDKPYNVLFATLRI